MKLRRTKKTVPFLDHPVCGLCFSPDGKNLDDLEKIFGGFQVFRLLKDVFRLFILLMYEDRAQNYEPEIHEEYLIHDTPFPLPHHLQQCAGYSVATNITN